MLIQLIKGDITRIEIDCIVNAANSHLVGGGGVDGAIHKAGGPAIMDECDKIRNLNGGCPVGEAVITPGGNLPVKKVIHTVGPIWEGGDYDEAELLKRAYENSMKLAREEGYKSIAFPNISTGIYGYPKEEAAKIAIHTIYKSGRKYSDLEKVVFVCFDYESYTIYESILTDEGLL